MALSPRLAVAPAFERLRARWAVVNPRLLAGERPSRRAQPRGRTMWRQPVDRSAFATHAHCAPVVTTYLSGSNSYTPCAMHSSYEMRVTASASTWRQQVARRLTECCDHLCRPRIQRSHLLQCSGRMTYCPTSPGRRSRVVEEAEMLELACVLGRVARPGGRSPELAGLGRKTPDVASGRRVRRPASPMEGAR